MSVTPVRYCAIWKQIIPASGISSGLPNIRRTFHNFPASVYAEDEVSNIFELLSEQRSLLPTIWSMKI